MQNKHDLISEFPEYKNQIQALKISNRHFARLFDEYHEANRKVIRFEDELEAVSDQVLEDAKKQRLHLKDELFKILMVA